MPQWGCGGTVGFSHGLLLAVRTWAHVEPLDSVMVCFLPCGPGRTKTAGGKTHSGSSTLPKPCWTHGGTVVEPWWIRSGTAVEPPTNLVEPRSRDGLGLCVFEDFECPGPRPTGSYIILRGDSTHANVAKGPRWQRPGRGGSRILPQRFLEFYQNVLSIAKSI